MPPGVFNAGYAFHGWVYNGGYASHGGYTTVGMPP